MSTVQEIIDYADRKFPNTETTANKVIDLNNLYIDDYIKIKRLSNEITIYEDITVAGQVFYTLPPNSKISDVVKVTVANTSDALEFDTYVYGGIKDEIDCGNYFGPIEGNSFFLLKDGNPLETSGLELFIYYYKRPAALSASALSVSPELDEDYHSVLKYGLIAELASQGHNPDTEIADFWQRRHDEKLKDIFDSLSSRYDSTPLQIKQMESYW